MARGYEITLKIVSTRTRSCLGWDSLQDEVIGITGRRSQHDDDRYSPVLKETGKRCIERPIAGPEPGEGQDTFATKFLHETALRKDDAEDVSKSREGDENR